ncbi:MAG TPA: hypothetical protein VGX23_06760 [Actinocrinis sp.]|nr:hypothetical protein [Actinocrinis sp.]
MAPQNQKNGSSARREQLAKARAQQKRAERNRKVMLYTGVGVLVLALAGGITWAVHSNSSKKSSTSASAPAGTLAPVWSGLTGQTVNGVAANAIEQLAYHIHAHLAIYVDGKSMAVPAGIGITTPWQTQTEPDGSLWIDGGSHFYYLHTHTTDGIIHIESPTQTTYKLGQFFSEWNQPLSASQVGPSKGAVTTYVNGTKYTGDPTDIALNAHTVIQLDVGQDVAPKAYTFAQGL